MELVFQQDKIYFFYSMSYESTTYSETGLNFKFNVSKHVVLAMNFMEIFEISLYHIWDVNLWND